MTVSTVVVTTPFSRTPWLLIAILSCRRRTWGLLPVQRTLLPLVDETHHQDRQENHHRPEAGRTDLLERHRPREKERDLEVEQDEEDGDEVIAHVEFHARVLE